MRIVRLFFIVTIIAGSIAAQETPSTQTATEEVSGLDSSETREALNGVMRRYPPQLGKVLKLDPTLFGNASFLATYPALAKFLAEHPDVPHNPAFYLENVSIEGPADTADTRVWREMMEGLSILTVMLLVTGTLVWLIRTLIEHRRWSRLTKTQTEVHNKVMDRLTSSEELLAYMQTPAGKRFLESTPIAMDAGPRAVSAPVGRMLWSVQVGLVLAAAGVGLQFVSRSVDKVAAQPMFAFGVLAIAIGGGFLLSAVVSFFLSRRLGLLATGAPAAE